MDGRTTDRWMDRWTDGGMYGWMDGWTGRWLTACPASQTDKLLQSSRCGEQRTFSWLLYPSRAALGTALPAPAPPNPAQPPPLPGDAPRRRRWQLVEEAALAPLQQRGVLQVTGWLGRGKFWEKKTFLLLEVSHGRALPPQRRCYFWVVPLRRHRTLRTCKFGPGWLPLLTPATVDGHQNQPDCNASQKADKIHSFS